MRARTFIVIVCMLFYCLFIYFFNFVLHLSCSFVEHFMLNCLVGAHKFHVNDKVFSAGFIFIFMEWRLHKFEPIFFELFRTLFCHTYWTSMCFFMYLMSFMFVWFFVIQVNKIIHSIMLFRNVIKPVIKLANFRKYPIHPWRQHIIRNRFALRWVEIVLLIWGCKYLKWHALLISVHSQFGFCDL